MKYTRSSWNQPTNQPASQPASEQANQLANHPPSQLPPAHQPTLDDFLPSSWISCWFLRLWGRGELDLLDIAALGSAAETPHRGQCFRRGGASRTLGQSMGPGGPYTSQLKWVCLLSSRVPWFSGGRPPYFLPFFWGGRVPKKDTPNLVNT